MINLLWTFRPINLYKIKSNKIGNSFIFVASFVFLHLENLIFAVGTATVVSYWNIKKDFKYFFQRADFFCLVRKLPAPGSLDQSEPVEDSQLSVYSATRQPFTLGVWTIEGAALAPGGTGFSLDYTQVWSC